MFQEGSETGSFLKNSCVDLHSVQSLGGNSVLVDVPGTRPGWPLVFEAISAEEAQARVVV